MAALMAATIGVRATSGRAVAPTVAQTEADMEVRAEVGELRELRELLVHQVHPEHPANPEHREHREPQGSQAMEVLRQAAGLTAQATAVAAAEVGHLTEPQVMERLRTDPLKALRTVLLTALLMALLMALHMVLTAHTVMAVKRL